MVHLVSAWHSAAGLSLGHVKTADKRNEIKAMPELLDALGIEGATITVDAMKCQQAIPDYRQRSPLRHCRPRQSAHAVASAARVVC